MLEDSEKPIQPRLAGVIIHVSPSNFEATERFYSNVLELPTRSRRPGFVNFEWSGLRLTLHLHDRVRTTASDPDRTMVNFTVSDLDTWHDRLVEAETPVIRAPSSEPWGGRIATYQDPDGNQLQLLELAD